MKESTRKGILVVSFGTSFLDSMEKTINRIEQDIEMAFPDYGIYRAFTSKMVISHLWQRDHIKICTVREALQQMLLDGRREIVVQPTHILNGIENDIMKEEVLAYLDEFDRIRFSQPLLSDTEDNRRVIEIIQKEYFSEADEAYLFMGHGTKHYVNTVYAALDYMMKEMGCPNSYMATVEAYPGIDVVLRQLEHKPVKRVNLIPFMIVAGDHVYNDMMGEQEASWKTILERHGYETRCHIKGLGEIKGIRDLYLHHLNRTINEA